jgi:hypothetical protein
MNGETFLAFCVLLNCLSVRVQLLLVVLNKKGKILGARSKPESIHSSFLYCKRALINIQGGSDKSGILI